MVLLTVGILIASVIFLVFKIRPSIWKSPRLVATTGQPDLHPSKHQGANGVPHSKSQMDSPPNIRSDDSDESGSSTPKARAQPSVALPSIPSFSIDEGATATANGAGPTAAPTRAPPSSTKAPRPDRKKTAAELMPPPPVNPSALRPLPKLGGGSLAPPPSAASTMRGPPGTSRQPQLQPQSTLSTSTLPPAKRASRKVQLEPGHSPLDWAQLKNNPPTPTFLRGAEVPDRLIKVLPSEVRARNGRKGKDAWGTWQAKVYNLTPYLKFHPGGVGELMRGAGKLGDAERLFNEIHPWVNWEGMLAECLVGVLVSEEEAGKSNGLEEID